MLKLLIFSGSSFPVAAPEFFVGNINPNRPQSNKIQQGEVKKMR